MARARTWMLCILLSGPAVASAQETAVSNDVETDVTEAPRNYANFRLGASSASPEHPELCLEVSPLKFLAVEGCGTGSGFLHKDNDPEIAHFRAKLRLASVKTGKAWLQPQLHAGFAELQIGEDEPGFDFNGPGALGTETAGPEVGASVKVVVPLRAGMELVGDVQAGAAWLPHASELNDPKNELQPSVGLTVGVGW